MKRLCVLASLLCGGLLIFGGAARADWVYNTEPQLPQMGANLNGMPEYDWWYGCSPTSGGMLIGWWDAQPGFENLYYGDASDWSTDHSMPDFNPDHFTGTHAMVASWEHHTAGQQNGYTYGYWGNCAAYPAHASNPNCIADFMKTEDGGSWTDDIVSGLQGYAAWDNPLTPVNESYAFDCWYETVPRYDGTFGYEALKAELIAGRPMLLDAVCYGPGSGWVGHSIVAFGYQDNMFNILDPRTGQGVPVTVGGFAVRDTWMNGTNYSSWVGWSGETVRPIIDENGVEWWPFLDYYGYSSSQHWDWMIVEGVYFQPVPEPLSLLMSAAGLISLAGLLRRRRRAK